MSKNGLSGKCWVFWGYQKTRSIGHCLADKYFLLIFFDSQSMWHLITNKISWKNMLTLGIIKVICCRTVTNCHFFFFWHPQKKIWQIDFVYSFTKHSLAFVLYKKTQKTVCYSAFIFLAWLFTTLPPNFPTIFAV